MKVCVMSNGSPDYLIDIVADGMIRLLGRESVSLNYNVRCSNEPKFAQLFAGFECPDTFLPEEADILVASTRSLDSVSAWVARTGKKKVAVLDGEDDDMIREPWPGAVRVYFKREFIRGRVYAPNVRPLPFAAIPEPVCDNGSARRGVFFSAGNTAPIRHEIACDLASLGFPPTPPVMAKGEYNRSLASALVGVSVRGGGWDTYRYWETAYFGAALLSQRLMIEIPGDFVDGIEAAFFDGPAGFAAELGRAGRAACLERHLSTNRAKTVLDAVL